jgi:beta-ketodecanoyl-[acyl-carrier-protein] synthase
VSQQVYLTGTGFCVPPHKISNEEIVASFNEYVQKYNQTYAKEIATGKIAPLAESKVEFIVKASGIKTRYVFDKQHILDPELMYPMYPKRSEENLSLQAEFALEAAKLALQQAELSGTDIDGILVSCSMPDRFYPAIAIELQHVLGAKGFGFDMNVACSSATFALATAAAYVRTGQAKNVLVVNPEVTTSHVNFRDRDSHFIFGDACTASIVSAEVNTRSPHSFTILDTCLSTQYSNNIRNNVSPMRPFDFVEERFFHQEGRKVFKEVTLLVVALIEEQLQKVGLAAQDLARLWLHQANQNMNELIAQKILGHTPAADQAPIILSDYANTASAGALIAFHQYHADLPSQALGLLCSFGAGYSIGSLILQKC